MKKQMSRVKGSGHSPEFLQPVPCGKNFGECLNEPMWENRRRSSGGIHSEPVGVLMTFLTLDKNEKTKRIQISEEMKKKCHTCRTHRRRCHESFCCWGRMPVLMCCKQNKHDLCSGINMLCLHSCPTPHLNTPEITLLLWTCQSRESPAVLFM